MLNINRRVFIKQTSTVLSVLALPSLYTSRTRAQAGENVLGHWTALADLPYPVQEIYPAITNGIIFVGGGFAIIPGEDSGVTQRFIQYSIENNQWSSLVAMPEVRHHPNLVASNNNVYALGGFKPEGAKTWVMQNQTWVYSIADDDWKSAKPAPENHAETVCLARNKQIHVISGRVPKGSGNGDYSDHTDSRRHLIYEAEQDSWHSLAPALTVRNSAAGAVINELLYVVGGRTVSGGNVDTLEVYDPRDDKWRTAQPMPQKQGGLGAAALDNQLIAFGGEYFGAGGRGVFKQCWRYDPQTDRWEEAAAMATPRHGLGAVSDGKAIFAIAGATQAGGNGTSAKLERFQF